MFHVPKGVLRNASTATDRRQRQLFNTEATKILADAHAARDAIQEDTAEAIAAQRAAFTEAQTDNELARERLHADLFCAVAQQ